jgi:hypothetical protein
MDLTFDRFTAANMARLPLFKNNKGQPAHSTQDGHDWSPGQWFQAFMGEVGELAQVRDDYESGHISHAEFVREASKEAADVQTYFVIMCKRFLDQLVTYDGLDGGRLRQGIPFCWSASQHLLKLVSVIGYVCNARKKYERGDFTYEEFMRQFEGHGNLLRRCANDFFSAMLAETRKDPADEVERTDLHGGIDLALACISKFNAVSERVGAPVQIAGDGSYYTVNGERQC